MREKDAAPLVLIIVSLLPATGMWFFGLISLPAQAYLLLTNDPLLWDGPLEVFEALVCGMVGLIAVGFAIAQFFFVKQGAINSPVIFLCSALVGMAPLAAYAVQSSELAFRLLWAIPLVGATYVLFRCRRMLRSGFQAASRTRLLVETSIVIAIVVLVAAEMPGRWTEQQQLVQQRDVWLKQQPTSYSYAIQRGGDISPSDLLPRSVTITDGHLAAATYELAPEDPLRHSGLPPAELSAWTIENVFEELLKAQQEGEHVRASFSKKWGYVDRAIVRSKQGDGLWDVRVTKFVANN